MWIPKGTWYAENVVVVSVRTDMSMLMANFAMDASKNEGKIIIIVTRKIVNF